MKPTFFTDKLRALDSRISMILRRIALHKSMERLQRLHFLDSSNFLCKIVDKIFDSALAQGKVDVIR